MSSTEGCGPEHDGKVWKVVSAGLIPIPIATWVPQCWDLGATKRLAPAVFQ